MLYTSLRANSFVDESVLKKTIFDSDLKKVNQKKLEKEGFLLTSHPDFQTSLNNDAEDLTLSKKYESFLGEHIRVKTLIGKELGSIESINKQKLSEVLRRNNLGLIDYLDFYEKNSDDLIKFDLKRMQVEDVYQADSYARELLLILHQAGNRLLTVRKPERSVITFKIFDARHYSLQAEKTVDLDDDFDLRNIAISKDFEDLFLLKTNKRLLQSFQLSFAPELKEEAFKLTKIKDIPLSIPLIGDEILSFSTPLQKLLIFSLFNPETQQPILHLFDVAGGTFEVNLKKIYTLHIEKNHFQIK